MHFHTSAAAPSPWWGLAVASLCGAGRAVVGPHLLYGRPATSSPASPSAPPPYPDPSLTLADLAQGARRRRGPSGLRMGCRQLPPPPCRRRPLPPAPILPSPSRIWHEASARALRTLHGVPPPPPPRPGGAASAGVDAVPALPPSPSAYPSCAVGDPRQPTIAGRRGRERSPTT
jgi:hypothetical protein